MTWIYSILFTSLAFVSEGTIAEVPAAQSEILTAERGQTDVTERIDQTFPLNPDGRVSLSNINGSVIVEAWDRNEVRVEAVKTADSAETLALIDVKINSLPERIRIEADYQNMRNRQGGDWSRRRSEVSFKLSVPRGAILNEIEVVNGSITVSNFVNITKVSTVNGKVIARDLRGNANLSTVNGEVDCEFQSVDPTSRISLSTVNGRVNLVLPSNVSATIKADTLNGSIVNDFGLQVRKGEYVGRDLHGRIGNGESQIKLDSVNGRLSITRKNDGGTPNPVTNLLRGDAGNGVDESRSARVNRDIDRSVQVSKAQASVAARAAKKELEKLRPELENMKELENLKIEVPTIAIKTGIEVGLKAAEESLAALRDVNFISGLPNLSRSQGSFVLKGRPDVIVNADGCNVNVRGTSATDVRYSFTDVTRSRLGSEATVNEKQDGNKITLTVDASSDLGRSLGSGRGGCRLDVFAPSEADVTITTEGDVRVSGIKGKVQINGDENSINVRDVDGTLSVNSDGGLIRVVGFTGDVRGRTELGELHLEGRFRSIDVGGDGTKVFLAIPAGIGATINSRTAPQAQNIELKQSSDSSWTVGDGSNKYEFKLGSGTLTIRDTQSN